MTPETCVPVVRAVVLNLMGTVTKKTMVSSTDRKSRAVFMTQDFIRESRHWKF